MENLLLEESYMRLMNTHPSHKEQPPHNLEEWYRGIRKNTPLVIEPKIDGVALALVYQSGELQRAYTRSGRDVTRYALEVPDIPLTVSRYGKFTVRGELYAFNEHAPKSQRIAAAQLRRIQPECHLLSFVAFQILNSQNDHKDNLKELTKLDFRVVPYVEANSYDEIKKCHNDWLDGRFFESNYFTFLPTDGIVVKINSRSIQKQLGQSKRCPHWAVALKGQPYNKNCTLYTLKIMPIVVSH